MNEDSLRLRNKIYKLAETNVAVYRLLAEWRYAGVRGSWDDTLARIVIALAAENAALAKQLETLYENSPPTIVVAKDGS